MSSEAPVPAIATEPEAPPMAAQALARFLGRELPGDPGDLLTPRQLEVLLLTARGKRLKEISAALGISTRTAERHLSDLLFRLDMTRVEAALLAFAYARGVGL